MNYLLHSYLKTWIAYQRKANVTKGQHAGEERQAVSGMCYLSHADHLDKRIALNMTAEKTNKAFFSGCHFGNTRSYSPFHQWHWEGKTPLGALLGRTRQRTDSDSFLQLIKILIELSCKELKNSLKTVGRGEPDALALYCIIINTAFAGI